MLRVASVPYLVGRPLDLGLEDEPDLRFWTAVPARLVAGLRDGSIDVALVSSIELFRQPGYGWLDGVAIAGEGYVGSVQVFLERPLAEVRTVALDPSSRTAAALAQVTWPAARRPRFLETPFGRDPRREGADAWLRIGDLALRESLELGRARLFNPSEAWRARTGLPFVIALCIVRPGVDPGPWLPAFGRARARGVAALPALAEEAARSLGVPAAETRRYLASECAYELGARTERALLAFRDAAACLGLCRGDLAPRSVGTVPTAESG
jgi:chorismate dehydratase